ncbi:MAG: DUF4258 domain-containing protein [Kiritimatiellae bacterium]|nr:DUF4258 domain-containing protein [Kiritimatiellia bacterium]
MEIDTSGHFGDMLKERNIRKEWVKMALNKPDLIEKQDDGTIHYIKQIEDYDNRWLRLVVNEDVDSAKGVTAFFDRRLRKKHEN